MAVLHRPILGENFGASDCGVLAPRTAPVQIIETGVPINVQLGTTPDGHAVVYKGTATIIRMLDGSFAVVGEEWLASSEPRPPQLPIG